MGEDAGEGVGVSRNRGYVKRRKANDVVMDFVIYHCNIKYHNTVMSRRSVVRT